MSKPPLPPESNDAYQLPAGGEKPSPRQLYRKNLAGRQLKIFGLTIGFLMIMLALGVMGVAGMLPLPFSNDFSKAIHYAEFGDTPCPPEGARAKEPDGSKLQILNASSESGLAGTAAQMFSDLGYEVTQVDNAPTPFRGNIQIYTGPEGVEHAYTIARYFDGKVRIRLQNLTGENLTIVIGEGFTTFPPAEQIEAKRASASKLTGLSECLPLAPTEEDDNQSGLQSGSQSGEQSGTEEAPAE